MAGFDAELSALGIESARSAASVLSAKAEDFGNEVSSLNPGLPCPDFISQQWIFLHGYEIQTEQAGLEEIWAIKAVKYAETHFKLLQSCDSKTLRLTRYDDHIFEHFQRLFKGLKLDVLNPDDIKSEEAKALWRPFCSQYENQVNDFNFGTLLRLDASKDYSEENTTLVPRVQFLAIEIARNRLGLNLVHSIK